MASYPTVQYQEKAEPILTTSQIEGVAQLPEWWQRTSEPPAFLRRPPVTWRTGTFVSQVHQPPATPCSLLTNLIAYWRLEEASGVRHDTIGQNHLTDVNTVGSAAGKVGSAAQFVRTNAEYLSIADNTALSTGNIDFTICAWVYLDTKPAGLMQIVSKEGTGSLATEYILRWDNTADRFEFYIGGSSFVGVVANAFGAPATATWYFIVVWHDSTDDTINIQVNDGTINTTATAGVAPSDTTTEFRIGEITVGTSRPWDGRMDGIGFWKRVLEPEERTALYAGGSGIEAPFGCEAEDVPDWWRQPSEPRRQRVPTTWRTVPYTSDVQDISAPAEDITVDKWYRQPVELRWQRRPNVPEGFTVIDPWLLTQPEETLLSKWWQPASLPRWTRTPLVAEGRYVIDPSLLTQPEETLLSKWWQPASTPRRFHPQYRWREGIWTSDPTTPEEITLDKWWRQPVELRWFRRPNVSEGMYVIDVVQLTLPEVSTLDKWWRPASEPRWTRRPNVPIGWWQIGFWGDPPATLTHSPLLQSGAAAPLGGPAGGAVTRLDAPTVGQSRRSVEP